MRSFRHTGPLAALMFISVSCAGGARKTDDVAARDYETLSQWLTGSFSSQEQAQAEPDDFLDIRLEMARIWKQRRDGYWIYVEQAAARSLDRPYRQRVYRLTRLSDGRFESMVFELPDDPLKFAGAFREPEPLKYFNPQRLIPRAGCSMFIRRVSDDAFEGSTEGKGCASTLRGASYATSRAKISAQALETWDQGFDDSDRQVWGATKGPYVFRRVAPPAQ